MRRTRAAVAAAFAAGTLMLSSCGVGGCDENEQKVDDPPLWLPIHVPGSCRTVGKSTSCSPGYTYFAWVPQSHCEPIVVATA